MKILRLCKDMFNMMPSTDETGAPSIKALFIDRWQDLVKNQGRTHRDVFSFYCQFLGGRGYNEFLDYSLFAIKLNHLYNKHSTPSVDNKWRRMEEAITNLLADDRHDMYQNVPYELEDVAETFDDPEKFYEDVLWAMIACINTEGTGDIAHRFVIEEE